MFIISVAGAFLKKVLDSGVRAKMDKTMMFLVQKSVAGAVNDRREGPSKPHHSVSIKLLDDQGDVIPNDAEVVYEKDVSTGVGEKDAHVLTRRKRFRTDDGPSRTLSHETELVGDSGVNKTITILWSNRVIMTPTADPRGMNEVIGMSIRPHERWTGGATVPLRAFQLFYLPQDVGSSADRARIDLVDRCLSRAGQVILFYTNFYRSIGMFKL